MGLSIHETCGSASGRRHLNEAFLIARLLLVFWVFAVEIAVPSLADDATLVPPIVNHVLDLVGKNTFKPLINKGF